MALQSQVGEKGAYFRRPHGSRMAHMVKLDEPLGPVHVGLLGADAVVFEANLVSYPVQQFGSVVHVSLVAWVG